MLLVSPIWPDYLPFLQRRCEQLDEPGAFAPWMARDLPIAASLVAHLIELHKNFLKFKTQTVFG